METHVGSLLLLDIWNILFKMVFDVARGVNKGGVSLGISGITGIQLGARKGLISIIKPDD